jgi:hypothetical protein
MRPQTGKPAGVLENRDEEGREMEPQRALFFDLLLPFSAKQMPYPSVALIAFRAYPSNLCIS